jgi:hypothetical protein
MFYFSPLLPSVPLPAVVLTAGVSVLNGFINTAPFCPICNIISVRWRLSYAEVLNVGVDDFSTLPDGLYSGSTPF